MEIEYFVMPGEDADVHEKWIQDHVDWWVEEIGLSRDNLTFSSIRREVVALLDADHRYPVQIPDAGIRRTGRLRAAHGLRSRISFRDHEKLGLTARVVKNEHSTERLTYFDQASNKHVVPWVVEPAAGVDRGCLAALCEAYDEETLENGETRIVLRLKPALAPIKVAVLPLKKNNDEIVSVAKKIKRIVQATGAMRAVYDDTAGIGKLYRRQDEVGTPFCVTVDFDTLGRESNNGLKDTVTVRDRDTMEQIRLPIDALVDYIRQRI